MASYNFPCSAPNCDFNTGDMPEAVTALALLQMHQTNNHVAAAATGSSVKPDKLTRPSITKGVNTEDWNFFIQRWDLYTDRCRLTGDDVVPQLLECCDTELTKDVYRTCGNNLTTISVVNLLATIKALSVTEENALVSRMLLAKLGCYEDGGRRKCRDKYLTRKHYISASTFMLVRITTCVGIPMYKSLII